VRNGNRWRVVALDPTTNRVAAERLSDNARAVFDRDYLTNHVTLGYAATVHSAQGVTGDSCCAILGDGASRAMLYVAMTRGRHSNQAFLCQRITNEADHDHTEPIADTASTSPAEAINTQRHTSSARSSQTMTDPAPCTPKPNAPNATYSRTWSPQGLSE